jgi:hypothetical protein
VLRRLVRALAGRRVALRELLQQLLPARRQLHVAGLAGRDGRVRLGAGEVRLLVEPGERGRELPAGGFAQLRQVAFLHGERRHDLARPVLVAATGRFERPVGARRQAGRLELVERLARQRVVDRGPVRALPRQAERQRGQRRQLARRVGRRLPPLHRVARRLLRQRHGIGGRVDAPLVLHRQLDSCRHLRRVLTRLIERLPHGGDGRRHIAGLVRPKGRPLGASRLGRGLERLRTVAVLGRVRGRVPRLRQLSQLRVLLGHGQEPHLARRPRPA